MFKEKPMQKTEKREALTRAEEAINNAFSRVTPDEMDQYNKKMQEKK